VTATFVTVSVFRLDSICSTNRAFVTVTKSLSGGNTGFGLKILAYNEVLQSVTYSKLA
jgi:hypothetical protein